MQDRRLRKDERLKSTKQLNLLFSRGRSFVAYPLRFVWRIDGRNGASPARVAFSASKKHWKRAVDRNLLKRRMREAYRLNKEVLYNHVSPENEILLSCIYIGDAPFAFINITSAMRKGLQRIATSLGKDQSNQSAE